MAIKKYYCLDCGIELEVMHGAIVCAWLRTDGELSLVQPVPGGMVYGKELGYVCDGCHDKAGRE